MLVQEGVLVGERLPPWWNDVVRDALVLVQEGKLTRVSFFPWWYDVV